MNDDLYLRLQDCLQTSDVDNKLVETSALRDDWRAGRIDWAHSSTPVAAIAEAGRPPRPLLVPPQQVGMRGMGTVQGRAAMMHAIAHIEFNAINLALDAAYRFRALPADYYAGWLQVAAEEAEHFALVRAHLRKLGYDYGDFSAHNGLWELAQKTAGDVLARMALVPRLMEARGLDATPPIMAKFKNAGDLAAVGVLEIILRDEVAHVALGDRWFRHCCAERGLAVESTYRRLLLEYGAPRINPPLNKEARRRAGFSDEEMQALVGN